MQIAHLKRAASFVLALGTAVAFVSAASKPEPGDGHERMVAILKEIAERAPSENLYFDEKLVRDLKEEIAGFTADTPPHVRAMAYLRLGEQELNLGREREAIETLTSAKALSAAHAELADGLNLVRFHLGVAFLRLGEVENCCNRNTPESCVLPIQGSGVHEIQEGSRNAIGEFLEILRSGDAAGGMRLRAIWLLNIAYMTLGEHPEAVPEAYRIPPERFESEIPFPRFENVAAELGVDTFSLLGGAIVEDFDGDGYLDIMVSSWHPSEPIRLFLNNGDGTFRDHTAESGLEGITGGGNLIQGDINNNGLTDVFVMRGGWWFEYGRHPNSLLRNEGGGRFRDVTFEAGLAEPFLPTQTAGFADFNNNGYLDLYVGNESSDRVHAPSQLFHNNGDGTFTDVALEAGVTNDRFAKGVAWGDTNGNGLPDLYVSNYGGPNRLYQNLGDGMFWDVALEENVYGPEDSFAVWFWDYNNNGLLDLFVTDYSGGAREVAAYYLGVGDGSIRDRLYEGRDDGGFDEVSHQRNLSRPTFAMGANFGDLNNDGYLDIFLGTGWPNYFELMPNVAFLNQGGDSFADVTTAGGFGNLQKGHGVAFGDFNNDGLQDVFVQMGGALKGDSYFDLFHRNPGFGNDWIAIRLRGTESNASAIGARIHILVRNGGSEPRSIYRHVNSGGSFGANPLRQTIGLGADAVIERLEIFWPKTGETQVFESPPKNAFFYISEGDTVLPEPWQPASRP